MSQVTKTVTLGDAVLLAVSLLNSPAKAAEHWVPASPPEIKWEPIMSPDIGDFSSSRPGVCFIALGKCGAAAGRCCQNCHVTSSLVTWWQ